MEWQRGDRLIKISRREKASPWYNLMVTFTTGADLPSRIIFHIAIELTMKVDLHSQFNEVSYWYLTVPTTPGLLPYLCVSSLMFGVVVFAV